MAALKTCGRPELAILCALALFGCADPMGPTGLPGGPRDSRPYYPLAVGNRWVYSGRELRTVDSLGSRSSRVHQLVLEVEIQSDGHQSLGQTYSREGSRVGVGGYLPRDWHSNLVRQDSEGLYEMVPAGHFVAPPGPAAGPTDGPGFDATRLVFPLRVGAQWVNQNYFQARAERMEVQFVPAGRFTTWRVALDTHSPSGKAFGHDWYGNVGLVKSELHWEYGDALYDSAGVQLGLKIVRIDAAWALQSFVLVGPPGRLTPDVWARP